MQEEDSFPCKHTCFICEQIGYSSQLLWNCAGSDHSARDFRIPPDHPAVDDFPHVKIHTQAVQRRKHRKTIWLLVITSNKCKMWISLH